ncbi:hypothetical protein D3C80_1701360 [compost metagenome]
MQNVLNLLRAQILTQANDEILLAPRDHEIGAVDHPSEISCQEIAVGVERPFVVLGTQIAEHHLRTSGEDFALRAFRNLISGHGIHDPNIDMLEPTIRFSAVGDFGSFACTRGNRRDLGATVDAIGHRIGKPVLGLPDHFGWHGGAAGTAAGQGRQMVVSGFGRL